MIVREIEARSILNASKIFDYTVNPYAGCAHSCSYCYARFMKRFTGHPEPWGEFVDVKIDAPALMLFLVEAAAIAILALKSGKCLHSQAQTMRLPDADASSFLGNQIN